MSEKPEIVSQNSPKKPKITLKNSSKMLKNGHFLTRKVWKYVKKPTWFSLKSNFIRTHFFALQPSANGHSLPFYPLQNSKKNHQSGRESKRTHFFEKTLVFWTLDLLLIIIKILFCKFENQNRQTHKQGYANKYIIFHICKRKSGQ